MNMYPCNQTRRESLWEMGAGFGGTALSGLLSGDGFFNQTKADDTRPGPSAPHDRHFSVKAKSCIFLIMNGAPSQVDTFDFKPELVKYAGKQLPESKKYINSGGRGVGYLTPNWRRFLPGGESGLLVSDYFPNVRGHADKLAVINSCHTDSHAHGSALVAINTGKTFIGRPSLGSWCAYGTIPQRSRSQQPVSCDWAHGTTNPMILRITFTNDWKTWFTQPRLHSWVLP